MLIKFKVDEDKNYLELTGQKLLMYEEKGKIFCGYENYKIGELLDEVKIEKELFKESFEVENQNGLIIELMIYSKEDFLLYEKPILEKHSHKEIIYVYNNTFKIKDPNEFFVKHFYNNFKNSNETFLKLEIEEGKEILKKGEYLKYNNKENSDIYRLDNPKKGYELSKIEIFLTEYYHITGFYYVENLKDIFILISEEHITIIITQEFY